MYKYILALTLVLGMLIPTTAKADVGFSFGFSNGQSSISVNRGLNNRVFIDQFGRVRSVESLNNFNNFNNFSSLDLEIARQRDRVRRAAFTNNRALVQLELQRLRRLENQRLQQQLFRNRGFSSRSFFFSF